MPRLMAMCLAAAILSGCAANRRPAPPAPTMMATYTHADHAAHIGAGPTRIVGQAFLRQRGGGVVTCAGALVFAYPDTPYFDGLMNYLQAGGSARDSAVSEHVAALGRATRCDARGDFILDNLPAADWIVMTEVTWVAGNWNQGGTLRKLVSTRAAREAKVLLGEESLRR